MAIKQKIRRARKVYVWADWGYCRITKKEALLQTENLDNDDISIIEYDDYLYLEDAHK